MDTIVDAAASAGTTLHVLPVPAVAWGHATTVGRALGELASATGGWLLPAGAPDLVAARLASILAAEYRLTIAFAEASLVPPEPEELVHLAWHVFSRGVATLRDLGDVARLWAARGDRW